MKKSTPLVSLVIRTKNEERWISSCLDAVFKQSYKNFEVIIVDNESVDKTVEIAKQYHIKKITSISNYLPGKALNQGINHSQGKYVVCLSAHCIPVGSEWLDTLVKAIEEDDLYAGVYGRQEPMSISSPSDKRDLLLVFGLDRKLQQKDSFFHNANSILRRDLWEEIPFNDTITNIEDRIWAQEMLKGGYKILYEPDASVFHYHGIHQNGDAERLTNVVNIIQNQQDYNYRTGKLDPNNLNIIAIIPIKGISRIIRGKPQLIYSIESAMKSKYINKIIVSTDSKETAKLAENAGASCPFLRPPNLSDSFVNLEKVQQFSLEMIEEHGLIPNLIVHLEETYLFRPPELLDALILQLLEGGYDSVIAARKESGWIWHESSDGNYHRVDSGDIPRIFKENTFIGLQGLGCVTHPVFIRNGHLLGEKTGIYITNHPLAGFEVRDKFSVEMASKFI